MSATWAENEACVRESQGGHKQRSAALSSASREMGEMKSGLGI